jgi:Na+/proline symporter
VIRAGGKRTRTAEGLVVAASCLLVLFVGLWFSRRASTRVAGGYSSGNRDVPWWAVGLADAATCQSGNGALVMIALVFGPARSGAT